MISLRYHAVSVAAVFFALAVGVLLGSTSVSESLLSTLGAKQDNLRQKVERLRAERNALSGELARARAFTAEVGAMAVEGKLADSSVVVISTADVAKQERQAMKRMLTAAGAEVTGTVRLTENFTDAGRAGRLQDVVTRLLPAGVQLPVASDPGTLAGGLLGPLVLLDPRTGKPQASPQERAAALAGLRKGGFLRVPEKIAPAQLAVVMSGGREPGSDEPPASMIARFAAQVDRSGTGAVLAGGSGSAHGNGAVGVARTDPAISSILSTVDNVDTAAGRVATVLALREQIGGRVGHYGTAGNAEGPVADLS